MEKLAHALAWEALVKSTCPRLQHDSQHELQTELAHIAYAGIQRYTQSAKGQTRVLNLLGSIHKHSVPGIQGVCTYASKKLLKDEFSPKRAMKALLHKHPHSIEIIALVAVSSLKPLLPAREESVERRPRALPPRFTSAILGSILHVTGATDKSACEGSVCCLGSLQEQLHFSSFGAPDCL